MAHKLPDLGYAFDALEPFIDAQTMEIHHDKHHAAYVTNLNKALEGNADLEKLSVEALLTDLDKVPEAIHTAVRNHGGGHANHSLFWTLLKKDVPFEGDVAEAINSTFGSFDNFKDQFTKAGAGLFGSGWAWLVKSDSGLEIMGTPNQELFVAVDNGQIVGFAAVVSDPRRHTAEIEQVFVHPRHRRWGIGTHLIETCVEHSRKLGVRVVTVQAPVSKPGWTVYLKAGFRVSGFTSDYLGPQSSEPEAALVLVYDVLT